MREELTGTLRSGSRRRRRKKKKPTSLDPPWLLSDPPRPPSDLPWALCVCGGGELNPDGGIGVSSQRRWGEGAVRRSLPRAHRRAARRVGEDLSGGRGSGRELGRERGAGGWVKGGRGRGSGSGAAV